MKELAVPEEHNTHYKKQAHFLLVSCFVFIASIIMPISAQGATPEAVISFDEPAWLESTNGHSPLFEQVSLTRGYAPLPILLQGFKSSPRESTVEYSWNFGDGNAYTENPNTARGLNAAHVYEQPGTYTATLTVRDASGNSNTSSVIIEVLEPDGATYWVDQNGNDSWTGLCEIKNPENNCGPWKTATKAFAGMAAKFYQPGDQILFKRGQTFLVEDTVNIGHYKGGYGYVFKAAPGSGKKPVLQWAGSSNDHIIKQVGYNWGHVGFVDLEIHLRATNGKNAGGLVYTAGRSRNLLFLRDNFKQPRNSAFLVQGNTADSPSGTFMIDSTIINEAVYPETSIQVFYKGSNLALLHNTFDLSGNHSAYLSKVDKGVITNNVFSRPAFGRTALRISGTGGSSDPSNNVQISDNKMLGWIDPLTEGSAHNGQGKTYHWRLVELAPNITSDQLIKDIVFERNILTNCAGCLKVANAQDIIIRDNIIVTPDDNKNIGRIQIGAKGGINHTLPVRDITITNNIFATSGAADSVVTTPLFDIINFTSGETILGSQHNNIKINNNTFYLKPGAKLRLFKFNENDSALISAIKSDNNTFYLPDANQGGLFEYNPCIPKAGPEGGWNCSVQQLESLSQWRLRTGNDKNSTTQQPNFVSPPLLERHQPGLPSSLEQGLQEAATYTAGLKITSTNQTYSDGTLIKSPSSSAVYIIRDNTRHVFFNDKYFFAAGLSFDDVITVSNETLASYSIGGIVKYPDGTLIKGDGVDVYLIENGLRRKIASESAFLNAGFNWKDIIVVSVFELTIYNEGSVIE